MLEDKLILPYTGPDDTTLELQYEKDAHEVGSAIYRLKEYNEDPSVLEDIITLNVERPKPNKSFFGTRRTRVTRRRGFRVPAPTGGETLVFVTQKHFTSIPVGISKEVQAELLAQDVSLMQHDFIRRLVLRMEC